MWKEITRRKGISYKMVQVAILAFVALFLPIQQGSGIGSSATFQEKNEEEVVNWATERYKTALDILLPFENNDKLGENIEWKLIVLITPPWDAESRLQITRQWDGKVFVSLARPQERSIYEWLKDIHRRNRDAAWDEVIRQIIIREQIIDTDQCPRLKPLINQLKYIKISIMPWSGLVMDSINYQIRCQTQMNSVDLLLIDIGHPVIIKWIERLIGVLKESCSQEVNDKNR